MKQLISGFILASMMATPALALDTPNSSKYDARIKHVTFNPQDVVQLDAVVGVATHIVLEEGEVYETHAFGDEGSYTFGIEGNHIFIKPKAEGANTNLIIVTDRRSYKFRLTLLPDRRGSTYELAFDYPDTRAREARDRRQQTALDQAFRMEAGGYNLSYTMTGNLDVAPVNAWDNGQMTYFKFASGVDLPTVYSVDADGNESVVNRNIVGDANNIMAVHKVNPRWVFRIGGRAVVLFNEAYNPNGVSNSTGTASPGVVRVIRGTN